MAEMVQSDLPRRAPEETPEGQALLAEQRDRRGRGLTGRERRAELIFGGSFVVAALALILAIPAERAIDWPVATLILFALALASQVRFEVASCYTLPTQLVFVPALFLLPPQAVPVVVALAFLLGKAAEVHQWKAPFSRVVPALGDAWFSLGPALIFSLAGSPSPQDGALLLIPAVLAQFALEMGTTYFRERLHGGAAFSEQIAEARWVYRVDALLTPVGLAFAIAAVEFGWAVVLVVPLFALLLIFAREREERIGSLLELSDAYRGTAKVLGRMVEHDDAYTGFHTRGVFELSIDVAAELGLNPTQRRNVEFGALLHDIGKITIPNSIINKPGPLTDEEWTIIRTHTIAGQRILEEIGGLMAEIGGIIRSAHERYDGTGYPDGLKGNAIPAESRVVFACDAYNAMTTDRPYRAARSADEAISELRDNSGSQFDPVVVEALARVVERELASAEPVPHVVPAAEPLAEAPAPAVFAGASTTR
jgi:hypothetical protein